MDFVNYSSKIECMIDRIREYGISNEKIFFAMRKLPRHLFIPQEYHDTAYGDYPVPTILGQTISQPYTVAMMLDSLDLRKGHNVLEVGAGSGWNAGLIKLLVGNGQVTAIEFHKELAEHAKKNLEKLKIDLKVVSGDGWEGYPKLAPFDRIMVTAACRTRPDKMFEQLKHDGILLAPVGSMVQDMWKYHKSGKTENLGRFRFVPCLGKGEMSPGWEG